MVGRDGVLVVQLQGAHKGLPELRQEMKRSPQERHMAPDGLAAGQTADGLVDYCLEDGGGQVFLGRAFIDQGLDIGFGEHAAAGGDGVERLVVFGILVKTRGVRLEKGSHLVDEGTGTAGAYAVHPLFHIAAFKVDDLGVLAAKLDGHVSLRGVILQGGGYGDYFLNKRNAQMLGQGQSSGTGDHRRDVDGA